MTDISSNTVLRTLFSSKTISYQLINYEVAFKRINTEINIRNKVCKINNYHSCNILQTNNITSACHKCHIVRCSQIHDKQMAVTFPCTTLCNLPIMITEMQSEIMALPRERPWRSDKALLGDTRMVGFWLDQCPDKIWHKQWTALTKVCG